MPDLPAATPRRPIHSRQLSFEGFLRDDGLWDIDCTLTDTKSHPAPLLERGVVPPGVPLHLLRVRLTVDDTLTIRDVQSAVEYAPFGECRQAADEPMRRLVGLTMGRGWRQALNAAIGGTSGCTHLRELVFNAATAAFQMIPHFKESEGGTRMPHFEPGAEPPFYVDQCMSWAGDGPVVMRYMPQFSKPRAKA